MSLSRAAGSALEIGILGGDGVPERRRGSLARAAAAWAVVRYAGLSQGDAAAALGMGTGSAVTHQSAKWQEVVAQQQPWRARVPRRAGSKAAAS